MPANKKGPAELTEAHRNKLLRLADDVLRAPSSQSQADYLHWFDGPVCSLVKELLSLRPILRITEANATPAIRVPSAWKTETHQLESPPDVVHSPVWITTAEAPEHRAEAEALAGMRAAAFLRCSGANVLLVLCHRFAEKDGADAALVWPGLYELSEQPNNEQWAFTMWINATAGCFTFPEVISSEGARRTYIGEIVRGVRWLRRELGEDVSDVEPWPDLRDLQQNLTDGLQTLDACCAADGRYPDELAKYRYCDALAEAGSIRARSSVSLPPLPNDTTDPHVGLVRLHDWCTAAVSVSCSPLRFPWGRATLAIAILAALELSAMIGAWLWGNGDNLFQKIGNFWWLLTFVFAAAVLSCRFILGKAGWTQAKKWWHSWRGGE